MSRQHSKIQLADLQTSVEMDLFAKFHSHKIGIIQSFNNENQTAEIQLVDIFVKDNYDRKEGVEKQPKYTTLLVDCPVSIPCNNGKGFTFPVQAGDYCLVHFNDRDIDNWFEGSNSSKPKTQRMHHIADGIAYIGIHSESNPIENYNEDAPEIRNGDSKIIVDEKISIKNAAHNLSTVLDNLIVALTTLKVQDGPTELPITAATLANLQQIQVELNELLE